MFKIICFLNLILQIFAIPSCYSSTNISDNGFVTYKNKVYDITNYNHPGGQNILIQSKGKSLEEFFDEDIFNFHITTSYDLTFTDLQNIYIGEICNNTNNTNPIIYNNSTILYLTITLSLFILIIFIVYIFNYFNYFKKNLNIGLLGFTSIDLIFFYTIYGIWWTSLLILSFFSDDILTRLGLWISLNIAFTLLPVTRNSLWIVFLKLSYNKLINIHKYIACLSLLSVIIKILVIIFIYHYTLLVSNLSNLSGTICSLSIVLTSILSIKYIRLKIYELFYFSHKILCIITIISMSFHYIECLYYVIPSIILYIVDIILRGINTRRAIYTKIKNYDLYENSTSYIFITLCITDSIKIIPGCYFFICCDNISKLQWHPLSLVCDSNDNLVFCIKNMGENSWSNNLIALENNDNLYTSTNVYLQGPYSHIKLNYNYSYILNIANGIGITPFISILKDIINSKKNDTKILKVLLIWIIPDISFFNPFKDIFKDIINIFFVEVRVYLTRTSYSEEFYNFSFINEKPDIYCLINNFIQKNEIKNTKEICVISCGSPGMVKEIYKASIDFKFDLYNETFN